MPDGPEAPQPYIAHIAEENPHNPWDNLALVETQMTRRSLPVTDPTVDFDSVASILEHAEYVPRGWAPRPLAELIRRRLELGIDENIHDATYWLFSFKCPEKLGGEKLYDPEEEMVLVTAAFAAEDPSKLPTTERRIDELFSSDVRANAYRQILAGEIQDGQDFAHKLMNQELGPWGSTISSDKDLKELLNRCRQYGLVVGKDKQAQTLHNLRKLAECRKAYNHDAQAWVQTHGTTPREKLVKAWMARRGALRDGTLDNPNAILAWERTNGIKQTYMEMEDEGTLPPNVTLEALEENQGFINELSRFYDRQTTIRALGDFLYAEPHRTQESFFPAAAVELSGGSRMEVFAKDDPRILTIGEETRCCMTPVGEAKSCVRAAYTYPDVSIMALYDPDGNVAAHSVMFVNVGHRLPTIVVDNIETNEGRDRDRVLALYQEFFAEYLQRDEMGTFDTVNLGVRRDEHYATQLKAVDSITPVIDYSDAKEQVLLYQKQPDFAPGFVPMDDGFRGTYASMEERIYGRDTQAEEPEDVLLQSRQYPGIHSYVITGDEGEVAGYVIAAEMPEAEALDETDLEARQDHLVLYIADLALLPEYRGQGHARTAFEGLLKVASRKELPILFQARDATSWQLIQARRQELEIRGYGLEVLGNDPDYFEEGAGAHLVRIARSEEAVHSTP